MNDFDPQWDCAVWPLTKDLRPHASVARREDEKANGNPTKKVPPTTLRHCPIANERSKQCECQGVFHDSNRGQAYTADKQKTDVLIRHVSKPGGNMRQRKDEDYVPLHSLRRFDRIFRTYFRTASTLETTTSINFIHISF